MVSTPTSDSYVFSNTDGSFLNPDVVPQTLRMMAREAELSGSPPARPPPYLRPPSLMEAGTHPKVVHERLGHWSISVTLGIYGHVTPSMQEEAAGIVENALRQAEQTAS